MLLTFISFTLLGVFPQTPSCWFHSLPLFPLAVIFSEHYCFCVCSFSLLSLLTPFVSHILTTSPLVLNHWPQLVTSNFIRNKPMSIKTQLFPLDVCPLPLLANRSSVLIFVLLDTVLFSRYQIQICNPGKA